MYTQEYCIWSWHKNTWLLPDPAKRRSWPRASTPTNNKHTHCRNIAERMDKYGWRRVNGTLNGQFGSKWSRKQSKPSIEDRISGMPSACDIISTATTCRLLGHRPSCLFVIPTTSKQPSAFMLPSLRSQRISTCVGCTHSWLLPCRGEVACTATFFCFCFYWRDLRLVFTLFTRQKHTISPGQPSVYNKKRSVPP